MVVFVRSIGQREGYDGKERVGESQVTREQKEIRRKGDHIHERGRGRGIG